tara:strand:+ start:543 stop:1466 length:924 start_codon:yes stop_codon:yes gene_type:complete
MENNQIIKSIGQAYQQVQEKLKGGQKKLDKDGDGDIDGSDFAMMRKKKKMDEADYDAKDDHNMDPTSHVQQDKKTGMFCVYNMKNQKVAEFKTKAEADAYAKKNHDDLMKPPAGTKDIRKEQNELAPKGMKKKKHDEQNELAPKGMKMKKHKEQNELAPKGMKMKKKMGEDEVVMNPKKKKQNGEKGANSDSNMAQEDTKWPIYQRIMEKNVVNQNAVAPEQMIPADKKLKDDQSDRVNQSQDHISAAAAQWIKDHDGNQVPDDAVDHEKVVAKNAQDAMRTVPNQAKDAINRKAVKPETMTVTKEK